MGGGSSRSQQATSVETTQTSENLNIQDIEGIAIANDSGDVSIVQTDHNAIGSATDLARRSVEAAEGINADSLDFATRTLNTSVGAISRAFDTVGDLAGDSIDAVGEAYRGAGDFVAEAQDDSYSFAGQALAFVRDAVQTTQDTIGQSVSAVLAIGKEQNTSADQRVAELAQGSQKNMLILAGIVGVALIAFTLYKGR